MRSNRGACPFQNESPPTGKLAADLPRGTGAVRRYYFRRDGGQSKVNLMTLWDSAKSWRGPSGELTSGVASPQVWRGGLIGASIESKYPPPLGNRSREPIF